MLWAKNHLAKRPSLNRPGPLSHRRGYRSSRCVAAGNLSVIPVSPATLPLAPMLCARVGVAARRDGCFSGPGPGWMRCIWGFFLRDGGFAVAMIAAPSRVSSRALGQRGRSTASRASKLFRGGAAGAGATGRRVCGAYSGAGTGKIQRDRFFGFSPSKLLLTSHFSFRPPYTQEPNPFKMPKKRRANGRNKPANARGHVSHPPKRSRGRENVAAGRGVPRGVTRFPNANF